MIVSELIDLMMNLFLWILERKINLAIEGLGKCTYRSKILIIFL